MDEGVDGGGSRWRGAHGDLWALSTDAEREQAVATIGIPAELSASSMLASMPDWRRWQNEIAVVIANATSPVTLAADLGEWAKRAAEDEAIAGGIYSASMQADLAGQLFVRQVEAPETLPTRALADKPARPSFLSLPFDEAIAEFGRKAIMTPEEFRRLSDAARTRAFTATRLASDGLRQHAYDLLTEALKQGTTYREFAAQLAAEEVSLGVTPSSPFYVETVFRTNVQSAYGAGRYRQITSPVVAAARPFVEYRTAQDSRVRPSHAALDGTVFRQDDPGWSRYAPPNGYNCRCGIVTLRERDVDRSRVVAAADLSPDTRPDPGFDSPPTVTLNP